MSMGQFRSNFKNPLSAALTDRGHAAPASAKVSTESAPKLERVEAPRAGVKQVLNARPAGRGPGLVFSEATGRAAGLRGDIARAKSLAPEKRQDIARRAASARWGSKKAGA